MKKSVSQQLIDFLAANPSKWNSGSLQRMEWFNKNGTLATPRSIVRRLEENAEGGGVLEVSYDEHGSAQYQIKQEHVYKKPIYYIPHPVTKQLISTEAYSKL